LRQHTLSALPASGHFGLAILLREGVAAWIQHCAARAASQSPTPFRLPSPAPVSLPLPAGIVQILATIALSRTQETRICNDHGQWLRALADAQQDYQQQRAADRLIIDDQQRQHILALASDFPAVWRDPKTAHRERKRMLALLIEDVTLIKQRDITVAVRFRGGAPTTLTLPRPLTAQQLRATHEDVRQHIDLLLNEYTDAQVARVLNERGMRTGAGESFDTVSVKWVRHSAKIKSLKERLLEDGWLTVEQVSSRLGIRRHAINTRRLQGKLTARICNDHGQWLYWLPESTLVSNEKLSNSIAGDAVRKLFLENRCSGVSALLWGACESWRRFILRTRLGKFWTVSGFRHARRPEASAVPAY
jgi:hypothetical protein